MRWQYIIQCNNKASCHNTRLSLQPSSHPNSGHRSRLLLVLVVVLVVLMLMLRSLLVLVLLVLVLVLVLLMLVLVLVLVLVVLEVSVYGCSVWLCEAGLAGGERGRQQPGSLS